MSHDKAQGLIENLRNSSLLAGSFSWLTNHFFDLNTILEYTSHIVSVLSFIVLFFVNFPKMKNGFREFIKTFKK